MRKPYLIPRSIIHNRRLPIRTQAIKSHPIISRLKLPRHLNLLQFLNLPLPKRQSIPISPHNSYHPPLLHEIHPVGVQRLVGNEGKLPTVLARSGEFPWPLAVGIKNRELFPVTWPGVSKRLHEIVGADFEFLVRSNHPSDLLRDILVREGGADDVQSRGIGAPKWHEA